MSSLVSSNMGGGSGGLRRRRTNGVIHCSSLLTGDSSRRKDGGGIRDDAVTLFLMDNSSDIVLDILKAGIDTLGKGQEARFVDHVGAFSVVTFLFAGDERRSSTSSNNSTFFYFTLTEALNFVDLLESILEEKGKVLVVAISMGGNLHRETFAEFFQKG